MGDSIRLFSYKMTNDTGFAPNPFGGCLTLATCKPGIRRSKAVGDWVAGFTSGKLCGHPAGEEKLVYLMQVTRKLPIAAYFLDPAYVGKRPVPAGSPVDQSGDNIYRPLHAAATDPADFEWVPNPHHSEESKLHDLGGVNVLVSENFAYFGREALYVPPECRPVVPRGQSGQGSRTHDTQRARAFVDFVLRTAQGRKVLGPPHEWPADDLTWQTKS